MAEDCCSSNADHLKELELEKERLQGEVVRLVKEKAAVQERLDFVEELFGPTEAQRKAFQDQLVAARSASLQAYRNGVPIPVRFVGRLDENWLRARGLSERDCALLQRGCLTGHDGVAKDVSMLGDPGFKPYTGNHEPDWEARGGVLRLSLGDVRARWGEEVALEVMRCSIELDKHDASRRLGVELPWNDSEGREMDAAEVIAFLERELLCAQRCCSTGSSTGVVAGGMLDETASDFNSFNSMGGYDDEVATPSPTWSESMFDSGEPDNSGFGGESSASESPMSTGSASMRLPRDPADGRDDLWSLADADIEQLLRPPLAQARRQRQKVAEAPRSVLSTPREELSTEMDMPDDWNRSAEDRDDMGEELGEVLRELLQEEVGGSLGRFLAQTPPGSN